MKETAVSNRERKEEEKKKQGRAKRQKYYGWRNPSRCVFIHEVLWLGGRTKRYRTEYPVEQDFKPSTGSFRSLTDVISDSTNL